MIVKTNNLNWTMLISITHRHAKLIINKETESNKIIKYN